MKTSYGTQTNSFHVDLARQFMESFSTTKTYAYYAKASEWEIRRKITTISQSNPVVITSISHGFKNGDLVSISGVAGMTEINTTTAVKQVVSNVTDDTFELASVNSISYGTYISGGVITLSLENFFPDVSHAPMDEVSPRSEILFMKRIDQSLVSLVVPFIKWKANIRYDTINPETSYGGRFYVINSKGDVYVCISNAKSRLSTVEPGVIGYSQISLSDGYVWKYLFSISNSDLALAEKYGWLRVNKLEFDNATAQWLVQKSSVPGEIVNVIIQSGGFGYAVNDVITANGDGVNFSAVVQAVGTSGEIMNVQIVNRGSRFTRADLTVNSATGVSATILPVYSTSRGIGHDARFDLLANKAMVSVNFDRTEEGYAQVGNRIRKMGIIRDPLLRNGNAANAQRYDCRTLIHAKSLTGNMPSVGYVSNASFSGFVTQVGDGTTANHVIYLSEVSTNIEVGQSFTIGSYQGQILSITKPDIDLLSGNIIYTENRSPITRSATSSETFNAVFVF